VILDCTKDGPPAERWLTWQLFVVFRGLDNYPVFLGFGSLPLIGSILERLITHAVLFVAVLLGKLVGLKSAYEEYTPSKYSTGLVKEGSEAKAKGD
jgi:hypothetical protein